jgi:hypothetical protein
MKRRLGILPLALWLGCWSGPNVVRARATAKALPSAQAQPVQGRDVAVEGAEMLIGRATFLRGGYTGADLSYDSMGHVKGEPKQVDWTLAGADIQKVVRRSGSANTAGELELDGIRAAVRYNPDQHLFERHPQKDEKLKIILPVNADGRGLQGALATIFAVGIDPALQRAMPLCWRHYFSPRLGWPNDDLTGQIIIPANAPAGGGVEFPVPEKKAEAEFTGEARQDHVKGIVSLRVTVGMDGLAHRIAIRQPLGYGLDARVVDAVGRYRFRPGMKDGKPCAVEIIINEAFDYYPPPPR